MMGWLARIMAMGTCTYVYYTLSPLMKIYLIHKCFLSFDR